MKHGTAMLLVAILTLGAGAGAAQMHPMMGGQHMMGPGMMHNMDMMHQMMGDMQQMTGQGRMTPEQQQMMNLMMQEMGGPQGPQMGF